MNVRAHHLFINGKTADLRGLDLAVNPYTGRVLGEVILVPDQTLRSDLLSKSEHRLREAHHKPGIELSDDFSEEKTEEITQNELLGLKK